MSADTKTNQGPYLHMFPFTFPIFVLAALTRCYRRRIAQRSINTLSPKADDPLDTLPIRENGPSDFWLKPLDSTGAQLCAMRAYVSFVCLCRFCPRRDLPPARVYKGCWGLDGFGIWVSSRLPPSPSPPPSLPSSFPSATSPSSSLFSFRLSSGLLPSSTTTCYGLQHQVRVARSLFPSATHASSLPTVPQVRRPPPTTTSRSSRCALSRCVPFPSFMSFLC